MTHVPSDHLAGKAKGSFRETWKAGPTVSDTDGTNPNGRIRDIADHW